MLPKIDIPIFTLKLPSNDRQIQFRQFLAKEEKLMLVAAESDDPLDIKNTIVQIVGNCVQDQLDIEKLPLFDLEYILINLRIRSVGNKLEVNYVCQNTSDEGSPPCNTPFKVEVQLDDVNIIRGDTKKKQQVQITDSVGLILKSPEFGSALTEENPFSDVERNKFDLEFFKAVVDSVYDKDNVYKLRDNTDEEISQFHEQLTKSHIDQIVEWLASLPRYEVVKNHVCVKCGKEHNIVINDLASFF